MIKIDAQQLLGKAKLMMAENAEYDDRHGGPFDRGSADNYYFRGFDPHYYEGNTGISKKIPAEEMTIAELEQYAYGFYMNDVADDHKQIF